MAKKIKKWAKKSKGIDLSKFDENVRKLDPLAIKEILIPLIKSKQGLKKNMGGAVMKNRGGTFKGTY